MNKSPIEWCDYTWNPITGCHHGCEYCYARRFAKRGLGRYDLTGFEPTVHLDRMTEPSKALKPSRIFVGSMGDLLGNWRWAWTDDGITVMGGHDYTATSVEVCEQVAEAMRRAPWHTYMVLTKANLAMQQTSLRLLDEAGAWIGVSVTGDERIDRMAFDDTRLDGLFRYGPISGRKFVSLEPLMGDSFFSSRWPEYWAAHGVRWVIIGGLTGPLRDKYPRPDRGKVEAFVEHLRMLGVAVFVKDNLGFMADVREYPEGMVV